MPTHIDTINKLRATVTAGSAIEDIQALKKTIEAMYKGGDPEVQKQLAAFRSELTPQLTLQTAGSARESWQKMADELDRNFALAYSPEEGIGRMTNGFNAAFNRVMLFGRETIPVPANANPLTQDLIRGSVLAAGGALGTVAVASVAAAALYGTWQVIRSIPSWPRMIWNTVSHVATHPIQSATAAALSVGGLFTAIVTLRNLTLPDGVRAWLPSWLNGVPDPMQQKIGAEQLKKLEDQRQTQEAQTDSALSDARDRLRNPNPVPFAQGALKQINVEAPLIDQLLLITALPADRRTILTTRRNMLVEARREMQIITRETPGEVLQSVTQVINGLDTNVANLLNPPTEREVAGVRVRFEGNAILLDGQRLVIEASQYGSPWFPVTLNTLRKVGSNLQANATATILIASISRNPVFTPQKIAEAINRYKNGQLPHEEEETDANGQPTGVQLKFSLAAST